MYKYRPDELETKALDLIAGFDRMEAERELEIIEKDEREVQMELIERERERGNL